MREAVLAARQDPEWMLMHAAGRAAEPPEYSAEALALVYHRLLDRADALEAAADGAAGATRRLLLEQRERLLDAVHPDRPASSGDPVYDAWCAALDAGLSAEEAEAAADAAQEAQDV